MSLLLIIEELTNETVENVLNLLKNSPLNVKEGAKIPWALKEKLW